MSQAGCERPSSALESGQSPGADTGSHIAENDAPYENVAASHISSREASLSLTQSQSTLTIAQRLRVNIQLGFALASINADDFGQAKRKLQLAFKFVEQVSDKSSRDLLFARCQFWEGIVCASLDEHLEACFYLLSAYGLVGTNWFEIPEVIRYHLDHKEEVCQVIDNSPDYTIDKASELKKSLSSILENASRLQNSAQLQRKTWYQDLFQYAKDRAQRKTSASSSGTSSSRPSIERNFQTMQSINDGDRSERSSQNLSTASLHSSLASITQMNSPDSSLYQFLHARATTTPPNQNDGTLPPRDANILENDQVSPQNQPGIDDFLAVHMFSQQFKKEFPCKSFAQSVAEAYDQDRLLFNRSKPVANFQKALQTPALTVRFLEKGTEVNAKANDTNTFGTRSRSMSQSKTMADRRSKERSLTQSPSSLKAPKVVERAASMLEAMKPDPREHPHDIRAYPSSPSNDKSPGMGHTRRKSVLSQDRSVHDGASLDTALDGMSKG